MSFLKSRNPGVEARFADIANIYKRHGERWHVRWDYAFYQMAVETNFLSYKQGNGRWGDVNPHQNNFAGLGTTGGGVPGDSYPDVNTGVLAQIQHLVAYSGEHIPDPVGARTKLKQDDIIESMEHLKGHVTFNDLSHRWAVDRHYGASIEWVANSYRAVYCKPGAQRADAEADKTAPAVEATAAPKREAVAAKVAATQKLGPAEALGGPNADPVAEPVAETAVEPATAEAIETPEPATVVAAAAPEAAALPEPIAPARGRGSGASIARDNRRGGARAHNLVTRQAGSADRNRSSRRRRQSLRPRRRPRSGSRRCRSLRRRWCRRPPLPLPRRSHP